MLTLTQLEREILVSRLETPDAIADATGEDTDRVREICDAVIWRGFDAAEAIDERLAKVVLADAVDLSLYMAHVPADAGPERREAALLAGRSLADKVSAWTGQNVQFPEF